MKEVSEFQLEYAKRIHERMTNTPWTSLLPGGDANSMGTQFYWLNLAGIASQEYKELGYEAEMERCGVAPITRANELRGVRVVFTGHLDTMSRSIARERVLAAGGHVSGVVTSLTGLVVAGPGAGIKLRDATKHEVRIISEQEFIAILENK